MAITNELQVRFNHQLIDSKYDFYIIQTSDKYISGGAYILDKPIDKLKAESVVFDNGRSLFIMFKKNQISKFDLIKELIDEKLTIKQIDSEDIKDYILFRLFLYSINNFECEENKFNNITGKLYITKSKWLSKNRKSFKALNINIDDELCITIEATTFTNTSCISNKKILEGYPKYTFSDKNGGLKRTFDSSSAYIRKSLYGRKAEISFLELSKDKIRDCKVYHLYQTLNVLKSKFKECLDFSFINLNKTDSIGKYRDEDFIERSRQLLKNSQLNLINWSNSSEYDDEFNKIKELLENKDIFNIKIAEKPDKDSLNLVYLHNKKYYEQNHYNDPYKNFKAEDIIQHITIEDCSDKLINDNEAIFNTILKEFVIKKDLIINKKITLDDWKDISYSKRLVFGREKDDIHYFMIINEDGTFELKSKRNDFSSFKDTLLDKCSEALANARNKNDYIIADDNNNLITISRTNKYTLPSEDIFSLSSISRSKESRDNYLNGVVDINFYNDNNEFLFNTGIKGSGMNTSVPKASILYKIKVLDGNNTFDGLLKTMSVPFVKYNSFTVSPYPFKYLNEYIEMTKA